MSTPAKALEDGWIDVSVGLRGGMAHWPDNPPVKIEKQLDLGHGDACTVSTLSMGSHTGTHMDAPAHFVRGGRGMNEMPFDATMGRARVVEIRDPEAIKPAELATLGLAKGDRVLFKTRNSPRAWQAPGFVEDFVYITTEAARELVKLGVRTVGVDYLSVGGYLAGNGIEVHRVLLDAGVWIIEGLDLTHVPAGPVELVCLPLKIDGGDGAPARAIVRPLA